MLLPFAIKSAIVLTALYIPYTMLLRAETFVRMNRIVLLTILTLAIILPLINLPCLAVDFSEIFTPNWIIEVGEPQMVVTESHIEVTDTTMIGQQGHPINWLSVFTCLYIMGVFTTVATRTAQFIFLRYRITRGCLWINKEADGTTVYCHAAHIAPFSWFNEIVISQADMEQCGEMILLHEHAHAHLKHSADMLLAMTLQALQWFNPFIWLLTDSLQEVHEYEADRCVLESGINMRQYQLLLIKKTVGGAWPAFANNLKSNQLKKRFKMMQQKPSSQWKRARILYVFPIALVALSTFATNNKAEEIDRPADTLPATGIETNADSTYLVLENATVNTAKRTVEFKEANIVSTQQPKRDRVLVVVDGQPTDMKMSDLKQDEIDNVTVMKTLTPELIAKYGLYDQIIFVTTKDDRVFDLCEEKPQFPGGDTRCMEWIAKNLKYPSKALEYGLQGKVLVEFIVEKDGSISNARAVSNTADKNWHTEEYVIDGKTVTGYGKTSDGKVITKEERGAAVNSLSEEAICAVRSMPNWIPGKQRGKNIRSKHALPIVFRLS